MTKPKLKWSPKAEEDLLDIYVTIGLENISAADRIYDKLKSKALTLIDAPRMGVERSDISLSARILIEKNYLIFYQIKPNDENADVTDIEIIRIVDGRRDLKALFLKKLMPNIEGLSIMTVSVAPQFFRLKVPCHLGGFIKTEIIEALGLSVTPIL